MLRGYKLKKNELFLISIFTFKFKKLFWSGTSVHSNSLQNKNKIQGYNKEFNKNVLEIIIPLNFSSNVTNYSLSTLFYSN
jgi:hypothetical protein